jgi:GntR family transcriptional regulator
MVTGPFFPSKRPLRRALYLQVRDVLTERIANGSWKPGDSIANEIDLARELGVSSGTVRKALELMEAQRVINRRQGRGTFVNDQTSAELANRFCNFRGPEGELLNGRVVSVEISEGTAGDQERRRLRLAATDPVYRIRRVRARDGRAYMVEDATVPGALFPGLDARREAATSIAALAQERGILLGPAEVRVSMAAATPEAAEALGLTTGATVMQLDRVVFVLNGVPAEWGVTQWHLAGSYYLAEIR